ncbi:cupin fold metalloprotein, WbuC family [Labilibacter sediminis]|nr:cupin fold metalloprotein, WbuC family [Labilibacter sediminis]
MKVIDKALVNQLSHDAQKSNRKRKNLNFHTSDSDTLQRMLNAFEPNTYVQPHTHVNPDKREVFIVLTGRLLVIFFNEKGQIIRYVILDRKSGVYGIEINPGEWHTATGLEPGTVVYEIKDGPYDMGDDKNFASWAPKENDKEASDTLRKWLQEIGV